MCPGTSGLASGQAGSGIWGGGPFLSKMVTQIALMHSRHHILESRFSPLAGMFSDGKLQRSLGSSSVFQGLILLEAQRSG